MKPNRLLAAAAAIVATAACNSEQKSGDAGAPAGAPVEAVAPPQGGDWSEMVSATPAGGFVMGNPNASVKLIEYGSMTCPHCAAFEQEGVPNLVDKYVKSGRVSFEFRNYVRDPYDLTAALIARCNGPQGFFALTRALFIDQPNWIGKLQTVPPEQQQALQSMPPNRQFAAIAGHAGFQQWAAMRGLPSAKSSACLANEAEINRLVQMTSDATTQYPDFKGTPAFVVNGKLVEGANWEALEPTLRDAVGG